MRTHIVVEQVLNQDMNARNSDKILLVKVWDRLGFHLTQEQYEAFKDMPSAETITRIRRKLQEKGKYPAIEDIKSERDWKANVMQQTAPAASPKYMEQNLEQSHLGL